MKRTLSFLLAIALTLTLAAPAFATAPNKTNTETANSARTAVEKTWITFNENGITISRGKTVFLPYQVSKINPTITIVNIGGVICLKFYDSTETLRLISLGEVENLVFNGRFPALTIDESIRKMNVTFGENASIGKLTVNGVAKVNIHEKMSVSEVLVNGAATVNFAKDAKIGRAIVTSPKAKINVPQGASFKVIYAFAVGASARPSRGSMNSGTAVSPPTQVDPPVDPVEPPVDPVEPPVEPEQPALPAVTVSTQDDVKNLKKDGTYEEITITGNESLNLTGITAKKVTVEDGTAIPPPTNAIMAASARGASERSSIRTLVFSGERIDVIDCKARAEIMSSSPFSNFTGNKKGIIVNAPVELLTVRAPLEVNREVTTINAFSDFAILGTGLVNLIDVKSPITISGSAAVKAITTAVGLNLVGVNADTVTTTGAKGVSVSFQSSRIGNLIADSTATTTITPGDHAFIETATANGNLTIEPFGTTENAGNRVKTVIVPATEKAITVTVNQEIYQLLTAKSLTIAGKSPVNNVIVTGTADVKLTVENTAAAPVISAPEGAALTDKDDQSIQTTVQYPAPKLTLTDANGTVLTDYTSSSLGNIVINAKSNTDIIYVKPDNVLPDAEGSDKYQCAGSVKYLKDYKKSNTDIVEGKGFEIKGTGSSTKDVKYGYFKTVKGDEGESKAASQIVSVTVNFPSPTKYVVTFDTNGGSPIAPMLVKKGAEIGRNEIDERTSTKAGASFDGWYKDKELKQAWKYSSPGETADTVTSDITLYAKWNDTDRTAPAASFDPIDGEKDVAVNKSISIFFDEPIVITGKVEEAVALKKGGTAVAAAVTLTPDKKQIVIKPKGDLTAATVYTVAIVADKITDKATNPVPAVESKFTTFNPKSAAPTVKEGTETVDKKTVAAAAVTATLSNEPLFNITATWKVYTTADGTDVADVTASCVGNQLTLTHATDITAGIYYVAVTEKDKDGKVKTESDRLALTVREKSRTPEVKEATVVREADNKRAVFTLTNEPKFVAGLTWKATNEYGAESGITATLSDDLTTLTLSHKNGDDIPPTTHYVMVTEKDDKNVDKAISEKLELTVAEKAAGNGTGKAAVPVAETLLTLSDLKVNGALIEGFNAEAFDYSVNLPAGTVEVPLVTATGIDPHAKVEILEAKDLNTATTVTVSANNGTKLVYTINFVVAAPTPEEIAAKAAEEKAAAEKLAADEAAAKLAADEKAAKDAAAKAAEEAAKLAAEEAAKPAAEKPAEENPTADPSANPSATAPTTPAN